MCQCEGREHRTGYCSVCEPVRFASGGIVSGSGEPWTEPSGCDYMIPKRPLAMPLLWSDDGDDG